MWNVPISLADEVWIEPVDAAESEVTMHADESLRLQELAGQRDNIAWRAAEAFRRVCPAPAVHIRIEKHIPAGSGLGGGSSDAAAVLRLLSELCRREGRIVPAREALVSLAASLGADVPFFLFETPALVRGVGEEVTPMQLPQEFAEDVMLVLPPFGNATPAMYAAYRERVPHLEASADVFDPAAMPIERSIENDFISVIDPALRRLLDELRGIEGCVASMSGSGSTLFVIPAAGRCMPEHCARETAAIAARHEARTCPAAILRGPDARLK